MLVCIQNFTILFLLFYYRKENGKANGSNGRKVSKTNDALN